MTSLSLSYTAPFIEVQRAKVLLLAHHAPAHSNTQIAKRVGCCVSTVREWRQRFVLEGCVKSQPRRGCSRKFSSVQRAQIIALACSHPSAHGKVFKRWSAEKLRDVAIEKQIVSSISASSIRRWLREDKSSHGGIIVGRNPPTHSSSRRPEEFLICMKRRQN
jgi:Transposase and inactivated derivatives